MRYLSILVVYFLISCDPCNDCESLTFEPTVEMVFINQDSLISLNDSIDNNLNRDSVLNDSINFFTPIVRDYTDSIRVWKDSIVNGFPFDTLFLSTEIDRIENLITIWSDESDSLSSLNIEMNSIISVINAGNVKLTEVVFKETNSSLLLADDSASNFSFPISYNKTFQTYEITIAGDSTYFVIIDYDINEEINAKRNVLLRADNISIVDTDFQDFDNCETNCTDSEAVFTFYF